MTTYWQEPQRLEVRDVFVSGGHFLCDIPFIDTHIARETARRGDRDEAITTMRTAVDQLVPGGQLLCWGVLTTGVFVETLLDRGTEPDVAEAEAAIEMLAAPPPDGDLTMREVWLQRMRALLARAQGDVGAYTHFRDRYRDMAKRLALKDTSCGPRRCRKGGRFDLSRNVAPRLTPGRESSSRRLHSVNLVKVGLK